MAAPAPKMTVVTVGQTGHVLGALTRRGAGETPVDTAVLLPDGVVVREPQDGTLQFIVPSSALQANNVDLVPDALVRPHGYQMKSDSPNQVQLLLTDVTGNPTLSATGVTISSVLAKAKVWVLIERVDGTEPIIGTLEAQTDDDVTVPLAVSPGTYNLLVLVTGLRPKIRLGLSV
jgi:hypothetical protein